MLRILLIDNYDSFTMNLAHALERDETVEVSVCFNTEIPLNIFPHYQAVVLSPGPGLPNEAGKMPAFLNAYKGNYPLLGVCLGHQAIYEHFGGQLKQLSKVYHGISRKGIVLDHTCLFKNIPDAFLAGSYHSWIADKNNLPNEINVTAIDEQDEILAFRHAHLPIYGVQFHPESVLTPLGETIIQNWINMVKEFSSTQQLS